MMNSVTKKKWKSLVAIAKTANEFSGKTGDSYDGRGYFPNKNMSSAVAKSLTRDAKTQGKALVTKMESQYDNEVDWNKGTRYLNVPEKMIKHKVEARMKKSATAHYINTENKMKYIFGESKMKKSDFKMLVQSIISEVVDVIEGKGDAPGATLPSPSKATPGQVSKGGFTLKDFSAVLGGVGGRVRDKGAAFSRAKPSTAAGVGYDVKRQEFRTSKLELFGKFKTIDSWRSEILGGGERHEKGKYQRNITKSKDTSSGIDTLASIRSSDDAFRKSAGGRKPGGAESFKVNAKYISGKTDAIKIYNETLEGEINKLRKMQDKSSAGDKNYVALENLIEDLGLKKDEYALRWDYASAAYSGNTSAMAVARSNIEAKRDVILKRAKSVGEAVEAAQWREDNNYSFGDKVTGSDGKIYTATNFDGEFPADKLGQINPVLGEPMWVQDKEEGGGETPTWEAGGKYNWGDVVKARDGSTWKATEGDGKDPEEDLSDTDPLDGSPIWVKQ